MKPSSYPACQSIKLRLITFCPGNCNANGFPFVEYANSRRGERKKWGHSVRVTITGDRGRCIDCLPSPNVVFGGVIGEEPHSITEKRANAGQIACFLCPSHAKFFLFTGLSRLDGRRLPVASLCPYPRLSHTAPGYCPLRRFPAVSWRRLAKEPTVTSLKEDARG